MKMKGLACILASAMLLSLSSCGGRKAQHGGLQGEVNISGAFALYPMTLFWAEEFQKQNPDVQINISGGGAGKGMTDALNDMVDFGMISREIKAAEYENGAWEIAVARDAVVATLNPENPMYAEIQARGLSREQLEKIFITREITKWNQIYPDLGSAPDVEITVYTRSDACGASETFAEMFGKHQEDIRGIGVNGDPGMASAVQKDVYSIGYNNLGFAYDLESRNPIAGLGILPLDINADGRIDDQEDFYQNLDSLSAAIQYNVYPAPPSRNLYLVSHGVPKNPAAKAFVEFILTEGQGMTEVAGYVALPKSVCQAQLKKLGVSTEAGENAASDSVSASVADTLAGMKDKEENSLSQQSGSQSGKKASL